MLELSDSWMLKPENYRKLKRLRTGIRMETGQEIHINDEEEIRKMLLMAKSSRNPRMKVMAEQLWKLLET